MQSKEQTVTLENVFFAVNHFATGQLIVYQRLVWTQKCCFLLRHLHYVSLRRLTTK